jgi:hypothetical protein
MGNNKFPKQFKTIKKIIYIRGKLFRKIILKTPIFSGGKPVGMFENSPKYELNIPRFNKLVTLLKKRNSLTEKWLTDPHPTKKITLTKSDLKKRGLPKDLVVHYSVWTSKSKKDHEIHQSKMNHFHKQLKYDFEYYKLVHFHDPDEPESKFGYPFFDLRYVLQGTDFKKWVKVIRLQLEYLHFNIPKQGRPVKEKDYPPEVLITYELKHAYAKKNFKSNEIDLSPHFWAVRETQNIFSELQIDGNRLQELVKKSKQKRKKYMPVS